MKKLFFFSSLFILAIFFYYKLVVFDKDINSKWTCNSFIEKLDKNNFQDSYRLLNKFMKRKYSLEEFTNILKTLKDENPCYTCNCLSVSSSDNFNLEIISCKKNTKLMDVSFGGGWGLGWNITNFHFH